MNNLPEEIQTQIYDLFENKAIYNLRAILQVIDSAV